MATASQAAAMQAASHRYVRSVRAFPVSDVRAGVLTRSPVTSRRLSLTPYGVQVNSVARSLPSTIRSLEKSDGSTTLMSTTL